MNSQAEIATLLTIEMMTHESVRNTLEERGWDALHHLILRASAEFAKQTVLRDWTKGKGWAECIFDLAGELASYYVNTADDTLSLMVRDSI